MLMPLLLVLAATAADAPAPSKVVLLEQAIYKEETTGDVEGAIRLYRQIIEAADAERAVAAQALYRLGLCLERRNRSDEARAAFERLVKDYPGERDLLAKVRGRLAVRLLPEPWVDGETLVFRTRPSETTRYFSEQVHRIDRRGSRWVYAQYSLSTFGGPMVPDASIRMSVVEADAMTFAPLAARSVGNQQPASMARQIRYEPGRAHVKVNDATSTTSVDAIVFDPEQIEMVLRRLPLSDGYTTTLPTFSSQSGMVETRVSVTGRETVEVPAGRFECFKVVTATGPVFAHPEQYWIATAPHRRLIRYGTTFLAELVAAEVRSSSAAQAFDDESWGVSVEVPPGWLFARSSRSDDERSFSVALTSPDIGAVCAIAFDLEARFNYRREEIPRQIAEARLKSPMAGSMNLKLREESWSDAPAAGLPAARFIVDFRDTRAERSLTALGIVTRAQATVAVVWCEAAPEDFEARRPDFERLLASLRLP